MGRLSPEIVSHEVQKFFCSLFHSFIVFMLVFLEHNLYIEMQDFKYGNAWPQVLICGVFF